MKKYLLPALVCLGVANAATLTYNDSFNVNESYATTTANQEIFSAGFLSTTVAPFDSTLGTLESFTITWTLSGRFDGFAPPIGGGINVTFDGGFLVQSTPIPYPIDNPTGTNGNGNAGGLPVGFNFPASASSFSQTYNVADAGTLYDQVILDALTGGTDVTITWDTPLTMNTAGFTDVTITATATSEFTYTYSPIPEPSSILMGTAAFGLACIRRRR